MNLPQKQTNDSHNPLDEFQSVTRLIAINALMEAAKTGRAGEQFSAVTSELVNLAKEAAEGDSAMTEIVEKQILAIQDMAAEDNSEQVGSGLA